ncbi:MAG: hypothetical protein KGO53_03425 [Alphaproteobacteria bacterium]|nr:hypothetical protein [Alphaproteobacteria bacterium]
MGLLREEEFEGFVKRRLSASNGLLIHGVDQAAVAMLARQVAAQLGGESQRVDIAACKASPGLFADDFFSLSLLGGRQLLVVDPADDACLKFLEPLLAADKPANFVLLQADALGKASKLRGAVESAALFQSLALYEEDEAKLRARLGKLLAAQGLKWGDGAEEEFFAVVGDDRTIATQELEKLALYALGQSEISAADVAAVCGDTAEFGADELIDAVLGGDLELADRAATSLGADTRSFFALLQIHVSKLQALRMEMDRGMNADTAIRNAKPPIFFKRKGAMINQLRALGLQDLMEIQSSIQAVSLQARKFADLAPAINSRALLSLARLCRSRQVAS